MSAQPPVAGPLAIQRIAIIGAREEGSWLAERAAKAGYRVTLEDLMPARRHLAEQRIEASGLVHPIAYAATVEQAVREADLAIDFVPDELESKLEIFSLLDRMAPPYTILATPSRSLSIADLASCTYRAERCVALRLPATLAADDSIPFDVEIVQGPHTFAAVVEAVAGFWISLGAEVSRSIDRAALP